MASIFDVQESVSLEAAASQMAHGENVVKTGDEWRNDSEIKKWYRLLQYEYKHIMLLKQYAWEKKRPLRDVFDSFNEYVAELNDGNIADFTDELNIIFGTNTDKNRLVTLRSISRRLNERGLRDRRVQVRSTAHVFISHIDNYMYREIAAGGYPYNLRPTLENDGSGILVNIAGIKAILIDRGFNDEWLNPAPDEQEAETPKTTTPERNDSKGKTKDEQADFSGLTKVNNYKKYYDVLKTEKQRDIFSLWYEFTCRPKAEIARRMKIQPQHINRNLSNINKNVLNTFPDFKSIMRIYPI